MPVQPFNRSNRDHAELSGVIAAGVIRVPSMSDSHSLSDASAKLFICDVVSDHRELRPTGRIFRIPADAASSSADVPGLCPSVEEQRRDPSSWVAGQTARLNSSRAIENDRQHERATYPKYPHMSHENLPQKVLHLFQAFLLLRVQWIRTKVHYLIPDIADFEKPLSKLAFIDNYP